MVKSGVVGLLLSGESGFYLKVEPTAHGGLHGARPAQRLTGIPSSNTKRLERILTILGFLGVHSS